MKGEKETFGLSREQAAALIFDVDVDTIGPCARSKPDVAGVEGELERILEEIGHGGRQKLSIHIDDDAVLDAFDRKLVAARLGFDDGSNLHFFDELGEQDGL